MVRKAYLTPPDIPEGLTCRTLKMPNSKEWLGVFNSALLTLTQNWQWEQVNDTDLTIDQAVAKVHEILSEFWEQSACDVCTQPGGAPFFRITAGGVIEQLTEAGWSFPEGDYQLPAIPPREGGTEDDKLCLAAKNAANAWKLIYEEISDSFSMSLTVDEAIGALIIFVAGLLLAPFSLIIAAILAVAAVAFAICYEVAGFITSDYWSSDFDQKLYCALLACASVDGEDVVTFDFDCFNEKLANKIDLTSDYFELMLFGQLQAMLFFIGGDGLNIMGATTAIADDDCDVCGDCVPVNIEYPFDNVTTITDGTISHPAPGYIVGVYIGYVDPIGYTTQFLFRVDLGDDIEILGIDFTGSFTGIANAFAVYEDDGVTALGPTVNPPVGYGVSDTWTPYAPTTQRYIWILGQATDTAPALRDLSIQFAIVNC